MYGAYRWDKFLPWVEDPKDILAFLDRHFDLAAQEGQNQDGPIQNALCALAYTSGPITIEALKLFNPTEPSFVHSISYVFKDDKPFQFHKATLLPSPHWG